MKKVLAVVALGIVILIPGCKLGSGSGNNYLNFEVIDTEQSGGTSINEMYLVALSSDSNGNYNVYNPITNTATSPGDAISLSGSESVHVSMNNSVANNLTTSSFLPNGFYEYTNNSMLWPSTNKNDNDYKVSLNYLNNTYSAIISNIPAVYTISAASCHASGNTVSCTVTTSGGSLPNAVVVYALKGGGVTQCTAQLGTSVSVIDYVSFSGCSMGSSPTLTMQIAYNVPLTDVTEGTNASFHMRGQYYFVSKAVSVTQ